MNPDQKFYEFIKNWAKERGFRFVPQGCDGRESPELIDGMAADDVWGWMLPEGTNEINDDFFGLLKWSEEDGKLYLEWEQ